MDSWVRVRLGDLVETQKGYAFKSGWYCGSGRPIVKVSDFTDDSVDSTSLVCIPEAIATDYLRYELRTGDVVVQTVGSWPANPASVVGKCIRIPGEAAGALLNQNAVKLTPAKGFDRTFLFYLLRNENFKSYIIGTAQGAASQAAITLEAIRSFEFARPPISEQRRIAGILSAYDQLIENCQRRIQILETMARALYREWFVHFRFPGHENHPRVASPLGEIPEGWEVVAFTEVAEVLSGGTPKTDVPDYWSGLIPFFTPRDAPAFFYVQDTDKHITELGLSNCASELYPPDTVFITARGTVGKVALPSVPMAMNQSCYALRATRGISQRYLFLLTLHQVNYLKTNTGGATFDTIVVDTFRRMRVVKPLVDVVAQFTRRIDAVFEHVNTLQRKVHNLRQTRDLLLPRLLSGEISLAAAEEEMGPSAEAKDAGDRSRLLEKHARSTVAPTAVLNGAGTEEKPTESGRPGGSVDHEGFELRNGSSQGDRLHSLALAATGEAEEAGLPGSPPIDAIDRTEVLCVIRQVFSEGEPRDRDTAIRDIARALGYARTGARIREVLSSDLLTAVRRGIVVNEGGQYRLGFRSFDDCTRESLKDSFESAIGRGWITRDDAIRVFARWCGFSRTGGLIEQTTRSLINGLLREGRLEADGPERTRRT